MCSCCQNWCVSWILGGGGSHPSEAVWGCWSSQSSADGSVSHILHVKGSSFILVGAEQFFAPLITNCCYCIGLDSNDLNDFSISLIKLFAVFGVLPLHSLPPSAWGRLYLVSPGCFSLPWPCFIHHCILVAALGWLLLLCLSFQLCFFFFSSPRTIQSLIQNIQWSSIQIVSGCWENVSQTIVGF